MSLTIYSKDGCKYCDKAKEFCIKNKIEYKVTTLDPKQETYSVQRTKLVEDTKQTTFPFIYADKEFIGGYQELLFAYDIGRLYQLGLVQNEVDF